MEKLMQSWRTTSLTAAEQSKAGPRAQQVSVCPCNNPERAAHARRVASMRARIELELKLIVLVG